MPIFQIDKNKLLPIKEKKFDLEKDIQKITEENLEAVFGYKLVCSEFAHNNLRIDTLAFDTESKAFIIIEYKRDKNFSVIDQGYAYLSLMVNNKADFILEYNDKMKDSLKRDDVDWSQSRVIFVSPQFTPYQKGAIGFQDLAFELWEVKVYDNNTILYNQLKPAATTESIKTITKNKTIASVNKEVRMYTVDEHFKPGWEDSRKMFDALSDRLIELDDRIDLSPKKVYIGYKIGNKIVFAIDVYKSCLNLGFPRTLPKDLKDPQKKVKLRLNSMKNYNQNISDFTIKDKDDMEYAVYLAKQAVERFS